MPVPIFVPNVPQNPPSSVVINSNERLWTSRLKAMSVLTRLTHACRWRIPEITPVFDDRVEDFAVRHIAYTHADTAQMLGHVIAHEIQFLLGHVSVQTTERYLGCKQRFREAVNDRLGIEPTE
jgi:integrase